MRSLVMEENLFFFFFSSIFGLSSFFIVSILITKINSRKSGKSSSLNLPPSPPSLPLIGHLHLLKEPVHRSLAKISQKYGDVVHLKFGNHPVILISSPSAMEECFTKNNDTILANRPPLLLGKYIGYNYNTVLTAPYGDHWRNLRKITSLEMLSLHQLSNSTNIRKDEIAKMVKVISTSLSLSLSSCQAMESSSGFTKIELRDLFKEFTYNVILRMLCGKTFNGEAVQGAAKSFTNLLDELVKFANTSYPGDFVSVLRWVDYGGYVKRCKSFAARMDAFIQGLIDEHRTSEESSSQTTTQEVQSFIARLLFLQKSEPQYYTDETIKGLILSLLAAGIETSAATLEWGMSLLLNNPNVLNKAKSEIDIQIGQDRLLDESDLPKLQYLQKIISETLRMFPPAPLLLPHMSSQKCHIGGFDIPCGTMLLVNAWAIHMNPNVWNKPLEFEPDRFPTADHDHYKFIPFGSGRRSCPGSALASRFVGLALGSLLQCFEWKRVSDEKLHMGEGIGLSLSKELPVEAMCKAHVFTSKLV